MRRISMETRGDNTIGAIERVITEQAKRWVADGIISEAESQIMRKIGQVLDEALVKKEDK